MRGVYRDNGYQEVKAPQILDISLWKKTGHWDNYRENMFTTESENRVYGLKPMNCPGHVQIFNAGLHSYRELPLRYGEFGQCHRNEPSGSLHGMMRVRGFTRTTATFSVPRNSSRASAPISRPCCRRSTATSASPRCCTRSPRVPRSASARTRSGTRPNRR